MSEKKISFNDLDWETTAIGIKSKSFEQNGKRYRLLELSKNLVHPNWCEIGHVGYVVEGLLDIDFGGDIIRYSKGDVLLIKDGESEKHIPKPISETVILFLIENI